MIPDSTNNVPSSSAEKLCPSTEVCNVKKEKSDEVKPKSAKLVKKVRLLACFIRRSEQLHFVGRICIRGCSLQSTAASTW